MRFQKITKIFAGMVMVATLATSTVAIAALDMFMKIDGIEGESKDAIHKNEIDVLAWSWGAAKVNKSKCVSVQDISFTKYVDVASPKLIEKIGTGQSISNAKLTVRKAGENPLEYLVLEMTNVIVSSISTGGSGGEDRLTENVTLNFGTIKVTYTPQKPDGTGDAPKVANIANTCPL